MPSWLKTLIAAALLAPAAALPAQAADPIRGVYASQPDACSQQGALSAIRSRFGHQVRSVPNLPQVGIDDFYQIRTVRFEPFVPDNRPIERRYCHATVALSDGHSRDLWFLIENPMGFASFGSNVEFCVAGFDRWHVYGGNCRTLR